MKPTTTPSDVPSIAGSWVIPLDTPSSKGEKAFRFIVQQNGPEVAASILRVDGDTGAYSGTYKEGKWVLSHFDGSRPGVIVVSVAPDGTLKVTSPEPRTSRTNRPRQRRTSGKAYDDSARRQQLRPRAGRLPLRSRPCERSSEAWN